MAIGAFFSRLKDGLSRSTQKLTESITAVFKKRRLDDAALEELEDLLISADLGPAVAAWWWRWPRRSACRCTRSASGSRPPTCARSMPPISPVGWWEPDAHAQVLKLAREGGTLAPCQNSSVKSRKVIIANGMSAPIAAISPM